MLAVSRGIGWALAAALVAVCVFGAMTALLAVRHSRAIGKTEARAFIDKVRACHRAPKPHPTWTECERLVRDRE